jgi:Fic family protein
VQNSLLNVGLKEIQTDAFLPLLGKYQATGSQGRYLHWNDFQWRVEKGDPALAAWLATKLARKAIAKNLSLLQAEGDRNFNYCVPDSLFAQLHRIDQLTGGGREINDGEVFSNQNKNRYLVKSLIQEEAITSSQLEGASTTREVAKEMLEKNLSPKDKSQQMILNNYRLMKKAVEKKDEKLSIEFILELHHIATQDAIENKAVPGEIREDNNIFIADLYGESIFGVAESKYECQFCTYPKVSLSLGFKNPIKEDSYFKSATPHFPSSRLGNYYNKIK